MHIDDAGDNLGPRSGHHYFGRQPFRVYQDPEKTTRLQHRDGQTDDVGTWMEVGYSILQQVVANTIISVV